MTRPTFVKLLGSLAVLAFLAAACAQPASRAPTGAEVALGVHVEQVRGHLFAALGNARAGRWELAAVHAGHPAEDLPAIDAAYRSRDGAGAEALRSGTAAVAAAVASRDVRAVERAVADADSRLAAVPARVVGESRSMELAYRASVLAALLEISAGEYGEGFVGGALKNEAEYQDAYAFLQRSLGLWSDIEGPVATVAKPEHDAIVVGLDGLRVAMPGLAAPGAAAVAPATVDEIARSLHGELGLAADAREPEAAAGAKDLAELTKDVDAARAALRTADIARARASWERFRTGWAAVEDGIRARDRDSYRAIEDAMGTVSAALAKPDLPVADKALAALDETIDEALPKIEAAAPSANEGASFATVSAHLEQALAALDAGEPDVGRAEVAAFRDEWTGVESAVKARSPSAYAAIENDTALALTLLGERPADVAGARTAVRRISEQLAPFVGSPTRYGWFDAAIILLREGFEALLVVAALLAFLAKTGNGDKQRWVWGGGLVGIVASVVVAAVATILFSASAAAGANRELLEGITGLVAAAMLVYVSYWLHSKSSLSAWQRYIREKSASALARNSLFSLALISFLAVFREGAETALFYLGIAPSIALADLALGLGLGVAGLVVIAFLVLVFGLRIPIRPFFLLTSVLVYYLAFKFVGSGIHALQVSGAVPATARTGLPDVGFFGVFPTVETTAVQALLLLLAAGLLVSERLRTRVPEGMRPA